MNLLRTVLTFITWTNLRTSAILLNSSQALQQHLQAGFEQNETVTLELNSSVEYLLSLQNFSYTTFQSFTIKSYDGKQALIQCANGSSQNKDAPTYGFAFASSTVTIERVNFKYCGAYLGTIPTDVIDMFNSFSPLYLATEQATALAFFNSTVTMNEVGLISSHGYAILGFDLDTSTLNSVKLECHLPPCFSNGVLLIFTDSYCWNNINSTVLLSLNHLVMNVAPKYYYLCIDEFWRPSYHCPVPETGDLTILYTQTRYRAYVNIVDSQFNSSERGGMLIVHLMSMNSTTVITDTVFEKDTKLKMYLLDDNNAELTYGPSTLVLSDSVIRGSIRAKQKVHILIIHLQEPSKINIAVNNVSFLYNEVENKGSCMFIQEISDISNNIGKTVVRLNDVTANKNGFRKFFSKIGNLFHFYRILTVAVSGNSNFSNNFGSVFSSIDSNLYLNGQVIFKDNQAVIGAAIRLEGRCNLYLMNGLHAHFIRNKAQFFGGAIYAHTDTPTKCAIQIEDQPTVVFKTNTAIKAGNSIFAVPAFYCFVNSNEIGRVQTYNSHFLFLKRTYNNLYPLSTSPERFKIYHNFKEVYPYSIFELFPGEDLTLYLTAKDVYYRNVYSGLSISATKFNSKSKLWVLNKNYNNEIRESISGYSTPFIISAHTHEKEQTVETEIVFTLQSESEGINIKLRLLPCPLGFMLEDNSGSCECADIISTATKSSIQCSINTQNINRQGLPKDTWVGIINNTSLALSLTCPLHYCNTDEQYTLLSIRNISMVGNKTHFVPLCSNNRQGVLCGQCNTTGNYCTVFGSTECRQCSNWWILTLLVYGLAGLLLVSFMFALKLTLTTGTLNGIIFYAQATNAGVLEVISLSYSTSAFKGVYNFSFVFWSLLNLNLGFPLCFFNGMDQLWKTGLSLLFPVYLLMIVLLLIVLSRHSTWLSNKTSSQSVQVLITLVHLSFSKLLLTLIDVFTPVTVYIASDHFRSWYWDGSIEYMGSSHLPLVVVTAIIVAVLLLPYMLLLALTKLLIRYTKRANLYLRPVHEAIHAPYKQNREYWFIARILLLIIMYITYILLRTRDVFILHIVIASLLAVFLIGQTLFRPYKSTALNILDCWLMLNITLVYATLREKAGQTIAVLLLVTTELTFGMILVYHIMLATNSLTKIIKLFKNVKSFYYKKTTKWSVLSKLTRANSKRTENEHSYTTHDGYRESLLEELINEY